MTSLYSLRSTPKEGEYIVTKFDPDYNVDSLYALNATECMCPAGHKPKCRHRTMLPMFLAQHHVDDGWFLDWDTRLWRKPVGEDASAYEATLADQLTLPCVAPGPQQDPLVTRQTRECLQVEPNPEATPMMDTIRELAGIDPSAIENFNFAAEEETQPPQASPPAAPPAPPLSRVEGAGGPIKRRRITL
jgi:hypothetical protein